MGMTGPAGGSAGGRKRHRRRAAVMSEINVTPFVDVMLVLLIIFMVAAPMMTVGVPVDLPQSKAKALNQENEPLVIVVDSEGKVFIQNTEVARDQVVPQLQAITQQGYDERIYIRGDRSVNYGQVMSLVGAISGAGFTRVAFVTDAER